MAVYLGGLVIDSWAQGDAVGRRLAIARLVNSQLATATEVAQVFGVHRNTVGRMAQQVEAEGATAAVRRKPGPRKRHKVTAKVIDVLRLAVAAGWGSPAAQREVRRRTGVQLSHGHIWGLLQQLRQEQPATLPLDLPLVADSADTGGPAAQPEEDADDETWPAVAAPEEDQVAGARGLDSPLETALELSPGEALASRYLGLTLFYPALQVVGLLGLAEQVYQLAGALRFGVQQVFVELFCLALLQEPTVERVKRVLRSDLGAVMGCLRAACVKTLRRKLAALSEQRQAVRLGTLLARHWLEVGLLNTSYLYVDGHVKVYSGSRLVPEVWNSQRRMPLPGIVQYFVNDLHGRPLLVVSQDVRGNLAKSLPSVIAAVRQVVGAGRFTVIFDRGGYDGQLFTWLVEQGLDFITYQRGEVHLAADQFRRREARWEGRRVRFQLAEDSVTVAGSGPWRRVVLRTTDGHQTPILTSLDAAAVAAARVTALMLARWRQENFFKYARAHLGLDVLTSYAADTVADREVPNPAVKAAMVELKRRRAGAQKVRAAVGQTVVVDAAQQIAKPDQAAAKGKQAKRLSAAPREALLAEVQALDAHIEQARAHLRTLPVRVLLSSLGPLPKTPQLETKLIAEAVKVAAYNAQSWLAERLAKHYAHPNDLYDLLRSFAQLSGTMTRHLDGTIHICLDPPDAPLCRRALEGLCHDLNLLHPVFPGTDTPVIYDVAMHHPGPVI